MTPFQFGVLLGPGPGVPADLTGRCPDAVVEHCPAVRETRAFFDRPGHPSLLAAVLAAVADLDAAGLAPAAVVPDDDLVTLAVVAARLRVARPAAENLLRTGPAPVWTCSAEPVYRWTQVSSRCTWRGESASARIFDATNLALRLRTATRDDAALAGLARLIDG